jgi:hypothetical protein
METWATETLEGLFKKFAEAKRLFPDEIHISCEMTYKMAHSAMNFMKYGEIDAGNALTGFEPGCFDNIIVDHSRFEFFYEGQVLRASDSTLGSLGFKDQDKIKVYPCRRNMTVVCRDLASNSETRIAVRNTYSADEIPFNAAVKLFAKSEGVAETACTFLDECGCDPNVLGLGGSSHQVFMAATDPNIDLARGQPRIKGDWSGLLLVPGILSRVLEIVGHMQMYTLFNAAVLVSKHWQQVCKREVVINHLDLSTYKCNLFADHMLKSILQNLKSVRAISLRSYASDIGSRITNEGIRLLADSCSNLKMADLSGCNQLTDDSLECLSACPQFASLVLGSGANFSNADSTYQPKLTANGFKKFLQSCPSLTALNMSGWDPKIFLDALCESTSLRRLCLRMCALTDGSLVKLGSQIEVLDIAAGAERPGQQRRDDPLAQNITDIGITHLVKLCTGLVGLDLSSNFCITDDALSQMSKGLPSLSSFTLATNTIVHCLTNTIEVSRGFTQVSDRGFALLCEGCRFLQHLDVSACYALTDAALVSISQLSGLVSLVVHKDRPDQFGNCNDVPKSAFVGITSSGIMAVASKCRCLTSLDISAVAAAVDDATLAAIGAHCQHLEFLDLGSVGDGVSGDEGFRDIANRCLRLRVFLLQFKREFPDELLLEKVVSLFHTRVQFPQQMRGTAFAFRQQQHSRLVPTLLKNQQLYVFDAKRSF